MAIANVTQATNKSTAVTNNKSTGTVTLNAEALAAAAEVSFTLTNSRIKASDVVMVNHSSGGTGGAYLVQANTVADGSCKVTVSNVSAGSLGEAIVLTFRALHFMG